MILTMKICNVVAILSISCLLPILAQKQDNAIDTAASTCENELGQCIDKNDTHKCRFPLAKLDCPDGKQCCKTFPREYDSAALPLTKAKKCTKKCPCCIASVDEKITNLESAMKGVDEKITYLESAMKGQFRQPYCATKGYQMAYGDSCYFISSSTETWSNAQKKCVDMGGNLVKIDNDEEFSFLQDQIHNQFTWIGLSDTEVEGKFTWISDGSILATQDWWKPGQPDNWQNKEDCVVFKVSNSQPPMLNDGSCSSSHFYICEM